MAENCIVFGKSGSGKSTSLMNFAEDEIMLINVVGKKMPFRKSFRYAAAVSDPDLIKASLKKMVDKKIKIAVIDDAGYLMTNLFMKNHTAKDSFKLFNDLADLMWGLLTFVRDELPEDVFVIWMFHEETSDLGEVKIRTIGKLLDQKCCIEGLCSVCLHCIVQNGKHYFTTQSNGMDIAKSPLGMFEDELIPNDLKFVCDTMKSYWGIK